MRLRNIARASGDELRCSPLLALSTVAPGVSMQQAVGSLQRDQATVVMQWINKAGPFWTEEARHGPDDYVECGNEVVTGSAVAEAAIRRVLGLGAELVSADPSDWLVSPVRAICAPQVGENVTVDIENFWDEQSLKTAVSGIAPTPRSWRDMADRARIGNSRLSFSQDCFESIIRYPFNSSSAERVLALLALLNEIHGCWEGDGGRSAEGHRLYQDFFTGDRAWFTDSSESEKSEFKAKLTFPHPDGGGRVLFCPWHGKESTQVLRVHFTWPARAGEPLWVVYVGPKLTKR